MKNSFLAMLLLCPILLAVGDAPAPTPHSPAAVAAIARHDKSVSDALAAYRSAVLAANHAEIDELKKAQADVMKNGGVSALGEGNAIQMVIDKTTAAKDESGQVANQFAGSAWLHVPSNGIVKFETNGRVTCNAWKGPGRWADAGNGTASINEPTGRKVLLVTVPNSDFALWEYPEENNANVAKRQH